MATRMAAKTRNNRNPIENDWIDYLLLFGGVFLIISWNHEWRLHTVHGQDTLINNHIIMIEIRHEHTHAHTSLPPSNTVDTIQFNDHINATRKMHLITFSTDSNPNRNPINFKQFILFKRMNCEERQRVGGLMAVNWIDEFMRCVCVCECVGCAASP